MKKILPFSFLLLAAADCAHWPDDKDRFNLTDAELQAGPSTYQMMGAFLNDRNWRGLNTPEMLDTGQPVCNGVLFQEKKAICVKDRQQMEVYPLKKDPVDVPYRVEETAYYCREDKIYYYHYVGGPQKRDAWLGPYPMRRERPKTDD